MNLDYILLSVFYSFCVSSMSSVLPPDVWYQLKLPAEVIDGRVLSALQLEAIVYACQQHWHWLHDGTRAGFLLGMVVCIYVRCWLIFMCTSML